MKWSIKPLTLSLTFASIAILSSSATVVATQPTIEQLWQHHLLESDRASKWANYYASRPAPIQSAYDSQTLAYQWRLYEVNAQRWAHYYYQQLGRISSQGYTHPQSAEYRLHTTDHMPSVSHSTPAAAKPLITMRSGFAFGLQSLPITIHRIIGAANALQDKPYIFGGGHRYLEDKGYDCSGATSFVLVKAGLLNRSLNTNSLLNYGEPGPGRFVTIWVKPGHHVFMTICGLRLDTSGGAVSQGPRWRTVGRKCSGFSPRHPPGL